MTLVVTQLPDHKNVLDEREREIIQGLYAPLRRYAAVVGSVDIDPDDLVQEAFLRVLRRGPLVELSEPGAYLRRTIVNLASNERRRLGRLRAALPRMAVEDVMEGASPSDIGALMRLDPRARAVLFLSAVEGYSFREVGDMVGTSEAAARKIASRARRKLRTAMASEEVGDGDA